MYRQKNEIKMDGLYIGKCRYEIQEQKEVPVRYAVSSLSIGFGSQKLHGVRDTS
jgi:hypothetical protein